MHAHKTLGRPPSGDTWKMTPCRLRITVTLKNRTTLRTDRKRGAGNHIGMRAFLPVFTRSAIPHRNRPQAARASVVIKAHRRVKFPMAASANETAGIRLHISHIPGKEIHTADILSRQAASTFVNPILHCTQHEHSIGAVLHLTFIK